MERKIGETFDYNGKKLEVVEGIGCAGCYFPYVGSLCSYPDVKNATGIVTFCWKVLSGKIKSFSIHMIPYVPCSDK